MDFETLRQMYVESFPESFSSMICLRSSSIYLLSTWSWPSNWSSSGCIHGMLCPWLSCSENQVEASSFSIQSNHLSRSLVGEKSEMLLYRIWNTTPISGIHRNIWSKRPFRKCRSVPTVFSPVWPWSMWNNRISVAIISMQPYQSFHRSSDKSNSFVRANFQTHPFHSLFFFLFLETADCQQFITHRNNKGCKRLYTHASASHRQSPPLYTFLLLPFISLLF